jgi:hypothetical protein
LPEDQSEVTRFHLELDSVFLDDGSCIGLDQAGTLESLTSGLEPRRKLAQMLKQDLASGVSREALKEKLQRYARHHHDRDAKRRRLVPVFAAWTMHQVTHRTDAELSAWIDSFDVAPQYSFRRAFAQ